MIFVGSAGARYAPRPREPRRRRPARSRRRRDGPRRARRRAARDARSIDPLMRHECIHSNGFVQYSARIPWKRSPQPDHIRADSVVDLAYERIRAMIDSGEIPPGARLGQVELAEQLGISRTPVREALRRLTGEGLAEFRAQPRLPRREPEHRRRPAPAGGPLAARAGDRAAGRRAPHRCRPRAARCGDRGRGGGDDADRRPRREPRLPPRDRDRDRQPRARPACSRRCGSSRSGAGCSPRARRAPQWKRTDVAEHRAIAAAIEARDGDRAAAADGRAHRRGAAALGARAA